MTRNELAQQVVERGIKTPKSPFFMSVADLTVLLQPAAAPTRGEKQKLIVDAIKSGKTRSEILIELKAQGIITSVGYLNNVAAHHKLPIVSDRKFKNK
jgi:hypothetical protein